DPDGDRIYVANLGAVGDGTNSVQPNVMVLQRNTLALVETIQVTGPARSIALNSDARQIFVGTDRGVHVINGSTLTVERIIPAGEAPWTVAAAGGTARQVFVGDARTGEITRFA
ncbi:MAG: YncE family protein, partial [Elainella sp.]